MTLLARKHARSFRLLLDLFVLYLAIGLPALALAQAAGAKLNLEDGTPVKLRLQQTLSSADATVDQRIDFDVLDEISVGNMVVIPKGSIAWGTVTEAQAKRRMGRGGKLDVNIDSVRLGDGEKAALRGVKDVKGGGHGGAMTGGIVATSLVLWPAAPLFLLMHGKDVTIPKGSEITVYINGNVSIDAGKFTGGPATAPQSTSTQAAPGASPATGVASDDSSTVVIKSDPSGAEVTVDGKYMGSTPSTIRLKPGDHAITIEKSGLNNWQRTVTTNPGGIINIEASLQKAQ